MGAALFLCQNSKAIFHGQDAQDALVDSRLGEGAVFQSVHDAVEGILEIHGHQDHVHPSLQGQHGGLAGSIVVGDGAHLVGVGDDEPVKAQLAAEIADDLRGEIRGKVGEVLLVRWETITMAAPLSMPAWKGIHSQLSSSSTVRLETDFP